MSGYSHLKDLFISRLEHQGHFKIARAVKGGWSDRLTTKEKNILNKARDHFVKGIDTSDLEMDLGFSGSWVNDSRL